MSRPSHTALNNEIKKDLYSLSKINQAELGKVRTYARRQKLISRIPKFIKIGAVDAIIMFTFLMADTTRPRFTALDLFITWLSALVLVTFMLALIRRQSRRAKSRLVNN